MLEEHSTVQILDSESLKTSQLGVDPSRQRFTQLLEKLEALKKCIQKTESFQKFYNIIGLTRQTIINGLQSIYEYFVILGHQIDKGIIRRHIGRRLIEGVHDYLQLENFEELDEKQQALYILEFETKFGVCLQFFHTIKEHEGNITSEEQFKFENVWRQIEFVSIGDKRQLQKKYNQLKKIMILTTTAILSEEQVNWSISKKIFFGLSYPRYYVDFATARLKSFIFYKYPTIKQAKNLWNIPELGATKQLIKIVFQSIKLNRKIYIPFKFTEQEYPDIFLEDQNKIQVRILNHEQLYFKTKKVKKSFIPCCQQPQEKDYREIDTILVHMHGGGFIALSSRVMQTMTRKWANQLRIPIFSIDYRKPPSHPFPAAPQDCLAVYRFIVTKINFYMNINPKNVYLAGDSAGGNLACSLMGSILKHNLTIPKGIYLAYPAVDLRIQFSPSKIHAVTDPLLWPSMLILCLNEYLDGNIENATNPAASPILLTQQFVGGQQSDKRFPLKWPKTMVSVGQLDPLYDDSLILMQKMKESNVDCKCRVYKQLSHGFLSTDFFISQCALTIRDSVNDLKKLIGIKTKVPKNSRSMKPEETQSKSQKIISKTEVSIAHSMKEKFQSKVQQSEKEIMQSKSKLKE